MQRSTIVSWIILALVAQVLSGLLGIQPAWADENGISARQVVICSAFGGLRTITVEDEAPSSDQGTAYTLHCALCGYAVYSAAGLSLEDSCYYETSYISAVPDEPVYFSPHEATENIILRAPPALLFQLHT